MTDAIGEVLSALLGTFERIEWVQRHLFPPLAARLAESLAPCAESLEGALAALEPGAAPDDVRFMRDRLLDVGRGTIELVRAFVDAARTSGEPTALYRALRRFPRVQESLFPLAPALEPVSRWFVEPTRRDDDALVRRLRDAALRDDGVRTGVLHAKNERDTRGGFSLYVPDSWDGQARMPLVVALHGGHGHGRDFLWTWLREARSRAMLVLAPTSVDRTWSLMGDDVDRPRLLERVAFVTARYPVDPEQVLLTGMSDGATYSFLSGLSDGDTFTHLAPACGVLHPWLVTTGELERARDRPIYLVHGALDWMFPVSTARAARDALLAAGARLVYREIADLSHTYPREENPLILDWLTSA